MTSADMRYGQCLWYAWGMADSGAIDGLTLDHGFTFAAEQKVAQERFNTQETHFLVSIVQAWADFLVSVGLRAKEKVA